MAPCRRALLGGLGALGLAAACRLRCSYGAPLPPAAADVTAGVTISTIEFAGVTIDRVRVDLTRAQLGLDRRRPDGRRFGSLRAVYDSLRAAGERPVALTNAGIFGLAAPVGLHLAGGVVEHPLERAAGAGNFYLLPNGVFLVGTSGAAVVESSRFDPRGVQLATQSGPLMVSGGVFHPRFDPGSHHALTRSGIGVRTPREVWWAVSRGPITFFDFARLFRDTLGCADALYLDGTISRLFAPAAGRLDDGAFMGVLAALAGPA